MPTFKKLNLMPLLLSLVVVPACADLNKVQKSIPSPGMSLVRQAVFVRSVDPNKLIHFTVWLRLRNKNQLDHLVNEIYDPNSPNYQKFLTDDEYNQQYAPSQTAEDAIQHYFIDRGMQAKIINHSVRVTATVKQIEQTLQVKMNYYRYQNKTVYANATPPMLGSDLTPYVLAISGLNDLERFKPYVRTLPTDLKQNKSEKSHEINMIWDTASPKVQPTTTSIGGFSGINLKTTYNLNTIPPINGTPIDGTGQTIVITDGCGIHSGSQIISDSNVYNTANGLPQLTAANFAIVNSNGTPFTICKTQHKTGWEAEIALDIEAAHTIAPGANIVLVLTQANKDLGLAVTDLVNNLIKNNFTFAGFPNAFVVSNSWGETEGYGYWPIESTFELAAAHGISFNFATGDCGDGTYSSPACSNAGKRANVQYPASSAYVTAVGGTSMFVDNHWNYAFENVWGTYFDNGFYFGGGGGISQYFGPVPWQSPITYFVAGGYGVINSFNKRALPDIAMLADPLTGLRTYEGGVWATVGGTSLASPLFTGTLALVNQVRHLKSKPPIGLAAPYLYMQNSPLIHSKALNNIDVPHQIISGAKPPPPSAPLSAFTIYDITFGWDSSLTQTSLSQFWDDAVGVGSPNVPNFVMKMSYF